MANDGTGEIRRVLIEMAEDPAPPEITAREALIAEITGYQDELITLDIERENWELKKAADSDLPAILDEIWQQLQARKKFLGVK